MREFVAASESFSGIGQIERGGILTLDVLGKARSEQGLPRSAMGIDVGIDLTDRLAAPVAEMKQSCISSVASNEEVLALAQFLEQQGNKKPISFDVFSESTDACLLLIATPILECAIGLDLTERYLAQLCHAFPQVRFCVPGRLWGIQVVVNGPLGLRNRKMEGWTLCPLGASRV